MHSKTQHNLSNVNSKQIHEAVIRLREEIGRAIVKLRNQIEANIRKNQTRLNTRETPPNLISPEGYQYQINHIPSVIFDQAPQVRSFTISPDRMRRSYSIVDYVNSICDKRFRQNKHQSSEKIQATDTEI